MTGSLMASIAIKATVILALGLGVLPFLRRSRAAVRHLLLAAVCATVFVLPIAVVTLPVVAIPLPYRVPATAPAPVPETRSDVAYTASSAAIPPSAIRSPASISIARVVLFVEGLGATLALLPLIAGLWQTRRLRRAARQWPRGQNRVAALVGDARIRRQVDVLVHDALPGPVTCGMWRPALLFPADATLWDDKDFERAAIHELEHVRRNDWATDCFARVVCALYWFHPLAWMTWRQLRLESERAADDAVVREREATAYADLLVTFAKRIAAGERNYVIAMAHRRDLPVRIRALLDESRPRGRAGRRCIVATTLLAFGVVLGVAPLATVADRRIAAAEQLSLDPRPVTAQQAVERPSFEVASIRKNVSVGQLSSMNGEPGGRMRVTNHSLLNIIRQVHRLQRYQIVGGPDWVDRDHWDITAKAAGDVPFDQMLAMMETLLGDRFKLLTHRETREMPVYALVLTRADGRLGSHVKPSTIDCDAIAAAVKSGAAPPPSAFGGPRCGININNNVLRMSAKRMTDLARNLSIMTDRFVVDRTGLNGSFDLELRWNDADGPSLATAVQEQLGLKLEAQRAGVDVLVIDSAQRPAED